MKRWIAPALVAGSLAFAIREENRMKKGVGWGRRSWQIEPAFLGLSTPLDGDDGWISDGQIGKYTDGSVHLYDGDGYLVKSWSATEWKKDPNYSKIEKDWVRGGHAAHGTQGWSYFDKVWQRAEDISARGAEEVERIVDHWRDRIEEAGRKGWHPDRTAEAIYEEWIFDGPPYMTAAEMRKGRSARGRRALRIPALNRIRYMSRGKQEAERDWAKNMLRFAPRSKPYDLRGKPSAAAQEEKKLREYIAALDHSLGGRSARGRG